MIAGKELLNSNWEKCYDLLLATNLLDKLPQDSETVNLSAISD